MKQRNVEVLAPAGSFESLQAAIQGGADAVYFGVEQLNMRSRSANFTLNDLPEIMKRCKKHNVKGYLTLNTIMYDHDLPLIQKICGVALKNKVDAVIASDIAAIQLARTMGLSVHCSTQLNISNLEAVRFFAQYADVIVLARELTLQQIQLVCSGIKKEKIKGPSGKNVKIEVFCHGALCVAISGQCYMSLATYNASANRGACLQNCRRSYRVIDDETGDELVLENKYVMSPKDLCTIGMIDKLMAAGVSVLKIEGRGKSPEYVLATTRAYCEAVESVDNGTYTSAKIENWKNQLKAVFNRGFWENGYYLGKSLGEWSNAYGSQATQEKVIVGTVRNYYPQKKVAEIFLHAGDVKSSDALLIVGPTTGVIECQAATMIVHKGIKEKVITLPVPAKVRKNDQVYVVRERHENNPLS